MSEYWKSTPKYWCKFCSVFVRDTKFEKQKHEATGRHQGGIQKSLRDLHRGKEQELREKDRAKNEIARLNGVVSGHRSGGSAAAESSSAGSGAPAREVKKVATAEDRKRQMAQLAAMGIDVGIPSEFRKDVALKGEWQTVAIHPIGDAQDAAENKKIKEEKNPDAVAKGVRKRKIDETKEEEEIQTKRSWGKDTRIYPSKASDIDLDDLLKEPIKLKQDEVIVKREMSPLSTNLHEETETLPRQAFEPELGDPATYAPTIKNEDAEAPVGIIFKKRKAKAIRTT